MRTLKLKKCVFRCTINRMLGGSSQFPTTAEHCFVVWTVLSELIAARSAVVGSWEEPPNIWLTVAKNEFVGRALNFRVHMLFKGAVRWIVFLVSKILPVYRTGQFIFVNASFPSFHLQEWRMTKIFNKSQRAFVSTRREGKLPKCFEHIDNDWN